MPTPSRYDLLSHALRELNHPVRLCVLDVIAVEGPQSPKTIADTSRYKLGVVAYHVRTMHSAGLLAKHRTRRVRGAVQTYYRLSQRGVQLHESLLG